jgi:hypothetical protein
MLRKLHISYGHTQEQVNLMVAFNKLNMFNLIAYFWKFIKKTNRYYLVCLYFLYYFIKFKIEIISSIYKKLNI